MNKIIVKGNLIWTCVFAHSFSSPWEDCTGYFYLDFFCKLVFISWEYCTGYFDLEFSLFAKTFSNITTFPFQFCFSLPIFLRLLQKISDGQSVSCRVALLLQKLFVLQLWLSERTNDLDNNKFLKTDFSPTMLLMLD